MNLAAEQLTGLPLERARGERLESVIALLDPGTGAPVALGAGTARGGGSSTSLVRGRDGRERLVEATGAPLRRAQGDADGFVLVLRDVTRERQDERRRGLLADASAKLAASLDVAATLQSVAQRTVADGFADACLIELLEPGRTLRNVALASGGAVGAASLRELHARFGSEPLGAAALAGSLRAGEPPRAARFDAEVLERLAAGAEREALQRLGVRASMVLPISARGELLGALLVASARPERHFDDDDLAAGEELARRIGLALDNARLLDETTEALRAREEFLSVASHELKTPLTSLQLHIQGLLRAVRTASGALCAERLRTRLESAERQAMRLGRLIQDLLDVSRVRGGPMALDLRRVDLAHVVAQAVDALRDAARRAGSVVEVTQDGDCSGRWDGALLEQAVGHLLSNAIKYGAGEPIDLQLRGEAEWVTLFVRDRGIGIAPEDRERIFARFERAVSSRHFGGLGVGLFVAHTAVASLGGSIAVDSAPGQGATFGVRLPRSGPCSRARGEPGPARALSAPPGGPDPGSSLREKTAMATLPP